jgi:hypothetical protein
LNTPLEAIDHVAGLPTRYATKLLGQKKVLGPMSFGAMLGALALKLAVMPEARRARELAAALARLQKQR